MLDRCLPGQVGLCEEQTKGLSERANLLDQTRSHRCLSAILGSPRFQGCASPKESPGVHAQAAAWFSLAHKRRVLLTSACTDMTKHVCDRCAGGSEHWETEPFEVGTSRCCDTTSLLTYQKHRRPLEVHLPNVNVAVAHQHKQLACRQEAATDTMTSVDSCGTVVTTALSALVEWASSCKCAQETVHMEYTIDIINHQLSLYMIGGTCVSLLCCFV